jgi:hypothetical protein
MSVVVYRYLQELVLGLINVSSVFETLGFVEAYKG